MHWPTEKGQTTIYKTLHRKLDRVTPIPLKTRGKSRCSRRLSSSSSTSGTRCVAEVINRKRPGSAYDTWNIA